jgi:hypothetical protein
LPLVNAASQPSAYCLVLPTRMIDTV